MKRLTLLLLGSLISLVVYPKTLGQVADRYSISAAYLAWVMSAPLTLVVVRYRAYRNTTTVLLWVLRWWAVVEYLTVTFVTQSINFTSVLALAGVMAPTFMYEAGNFVAHQRIEAPLVKVICWLITISVIPVFVAALFILCTGGLDNLLRSASTLRQLYHYGWLNDVALLVVIGFFSLLSLPRRHGHLWMAGLYLMVLVTTFSRTGAIALLMGGLISAILARASFKRTIFFTVLACVILLFLFMGRNILPSSDLVRTMVLRYGRWVAGLDYLVEHPWFGLGLRSFTETVGYYLNPLTGQYTEMGSIHNDYLDLLVRGGLSYFGLFLSVVVSYLLRCIRKASQSSYVRLSVTVVIVILLGSFAHNPLKNGTLSSLFWLFMGIGSGCQMRDDKNLEQQVMSGRFLQYAPSERSGNPTFKRKGNY
ncbi:MAG: O-antigen ligase family protein [Candidatus Fermentithermobacillus carboniphilus]|uniref:O-antigen ligase family protein n=1 Tax=Candidatus Fermentithermobacillus carboniphilus TaxID=3085328 RepID=A0AAT9LFG8_9FIRM|nr:MAG: O-antigen ligase family protein [Candidatus Fermentithermobacillus carboniphilus]